MSWDTWIQDVAGSVIGKAADAKYSQPYEIERLRLQALGSTGYYTEGQAGIKAGAQPAVSGTVLLIGGAVLLFLLAKSD